MKADDYLEKVNDEIEEKFKNGVRALNRRNYEKSEEIFIEILEEKPEFAPAYNKLGVLYIFQEKYNVAEENLNKALRVDNEYVPSLINLGNLMKEHGNNQQAKNFYEKAIDIEPNYGPAYNNLSVIYREEGRMTKSIKFMKKASKHGGFSVKSDVDKPLYKEPGCIFIIGIIIVIILSLIWVVT